MVIVKSNITVSCVLSANKMHLVKLELPPNEAGDVLTVNHLAKEVCIETGVDLWNQILTFKGQLKWFSTGVLGSGPAKSEVALSFYV